MTGSVAGPQQGGPSAWTIMVAIPVKNEAERIAACLTALSLQRAPAGHELPPYGVLLFVNDSDDGTAEIAQSLSPSLSFPLSVVTAFLPAHEASAGGARRHAMAAAARLLEMQATPGLLMTTDADSRVPPDWIANTVAAIEAGADVVLGTIALDPDDEAALPQTLKARGALEACYEELVCALETRLHPLAHDPWPRHASESGASLALTLASFRAVGGVPDQPLGEDRALVTALRRAGFRIRHTPDIVVVTSGRLFGRAAGGCADTMRLRIEVPTARCDEYLRPALDILRDPAPFDLGACSPRRRLGPRDLPGQIRIARVLLAGLKMRDAFRAILSRAGRLQMAPAPRPPAYKTGHGKAEQRGSPP